MTDLSKRARKPIHSVKKDASAKDPLYSAMLHDASIKDAQVKVDELALHLPDGIKTFVITEQDDDEIRFYVGVRVSF